nr:pyruvate formate lyase activating enzyme [Candidatus Cloacimonadota bacterium]
MSEMIREAMYYRTLDKSHLKCELCPHFCVIPIGERGRCRSRGNLDNHLWAINYGKALGISLDPIEKKPLYHFFPGSKILSLGPNSCNLNCKWCQNYQISQFEANTIDMPLDELYGLVQQYSPSTKHIAFTYTEPLTWYEYIMDFAVQYPDVKVVLVTNGFINEEPLTELLPHISAMNIDLKGMSEDLYHNYCGGKLSTVKNAIIQSYKANVHIEITLLLIPGLNDSKEKLVNLVDFIASIDINIPLHISAYHPDFMMDIPATTIDDIQRAYDIAKAKLRYVYGGNLPVDDMRDTFCPECGTQVISRRIFGQILNKAKSGKCPKCGQRIYGCIV